MAKRVQLTIPMQVTVRDLDMRLLDILEKKTVTPRKGVMMPSREAATALGVSDATAHRSLVNCVEQGYVSVRVNRQDTGAQMPNSYVFTKQGKMLLTAAREMGVC